MLTLVLLHGWSDGLPLDCRISQVDYYVGDRLSNQAESSLGEQEREDAMVFHPQTGSK